MDNGAGTGRWCCQVCLGDTSFLEPLGLLAWILCPTFVLCMTYLEAVGAHGLLRFGICKAAALSIF
jgi:hypothetical protein